MGSISCHVTLLVNGSLGGGHTHVRAYRYSRTEAILRNQARASLWPACARFKNIFKKEGKIDCELMKT